MSRRTYATGLACAVAAILLAAPAVSAADPESGPPPTAAELAVSDAKTQLALDWIAVKQGKLAASTFAKQHPSYAGVSLATAEAKAGTADASTFTTTAATAGTLGMSQKSQANSYYCGPATAYEIVKYLGGNGPAGETVTQGHLAAHCSPGYLCTDALTETPFYVGTSYNDASGYPMTSTLNKWDDTTWYITTKGPTYNEANYENDLTFDIDHAHPIAINIQEVANSGYHLPGHPTNRAIGHWVAASGYDQSGVRTYYADSVYGVSTSVISWANSVTNPYSYFASAKFYSLFSTRGFVW